jgi:hypothetical protein
MAFRCRPVAGGLRELPGTLLVTLPDAFQSFAQRRELWVCPVRAQAGEAGLSIILARVHLTSQ